MPKGTISSSGYNALSGIPVDIEVAAQPQIGSNNKLVSFKGPWTMEEDSILREMVTRLGEGKWSLIAQSLPSRIGKQCRDRWINHLNPNIKKNRIWTVEEDMVLIRAHKSYGKCWATMVRFLPGRAENDIKNHWNTTRRSLFSKRQMKRKSQQVPPRQLSILAEYIRSVEPDSKSSSPQQPAYPPADTSTPEMQMHLNAPNQPGAVDLNNSLLPDLNITFDPQEIHHPLVTQEPQQATFREAGPSNICGSDDPAGDTNTVLDLASREFIMPSSEEVSLGLARFM